MKKLLLSKRVSERTKGAALVEFAFILVPLLHAFFGLVQISLIYTANLMLNHAAHAAVRAYAVIHEPNPGPNGSDADVEQAAKLALGPWNGPLTIDSVQTWSTATPSLPHHVYDIDYARVTATYKCQVPLGNWLTCGAGRTKTFSSERTYFPHQGARYKYE